jgi:hypothetical protein
VAVTPAKKKAYMDEWRAKNQSHIKSYAKAYRARTVERRRAEQRAWMETDREAKLKKKRDYANARYRAGHRWKPHTQEQIERKKATARIYFKRIYRERINHRIAVNLRSRISRFLRGRERQSTKSLLGIDVDGYRAYLQSLFEAEMSWDNYGTYWEIDHIRPCRSFDLTKSEQVAECFHYTNTRPLSVYLNRKFGRRFQAEMIGDKFIVTEGFKEL